MPGDAYIPDDDDDENIANFSTATGNIDFAASIEKVKSVSWFQKGYRRALKLL